MKSSPDASFRGSETETRRGMREAMPIYDRVIGKGAWACPP